MRIANLFLFILAGHLILNGLQMAYLGKARPPLRTLEIEIADSISTDNASRNERLKLILKKEKHFIDSLASDTSALILLAKVPGKKTLVRVFNDRWPEEVEKSYVILSRNSLIRYFVEIPFSGSGDWFIAYKSYFNAHGQLFAFQKETNFFNSECTEGAAHEVSLKFYDPHFLLIDSVYTLTDSDSRPLNRSSCFFPYDFPAKIYRSTSKLKEKVNLGGY